MATDKTDPIHKSIEVTLSTGTVWTGDITIYFDYFGNYRSYEIESETKVNADGGDMTWNEQRELTRYIDSHIEDWI